MKRRVYLCFAIMPVIYIIMMLYERRIGNINNVAAVALYALMCLILGVMVMKQHIVFFKKIYYMPISIVIFITIDMGIKMILCQMLDKPIIIFGDTLEISISKNINQSAILNYLNIEYSLLVMLLIKVLLIVLIIVFYKYFVSRCERDLFGYIHLAFILFFSASFCNLLDSLCYGYTLDYILFVDLMCCDIKDFNADIGVGVFLVYYYKQCRICSENV